LTKWTAVFLNDRIWLYPTAMGHFTIEQGFPRAPDAHRSNDRDKSALIERLECIWPHFHNLSDQTVVSIPVSQVFSDLLVSFFVRIRTPSMPASLPPCRLPG
jgi:hypothetical protein